MTTDTEAMRAALVKAFENADALDWEHLFNMLPESGHGKFWRAVLTEAKAALALPQGADPSPLTEEKAREILGERNPFDWKRPENIDAHPLRYAAVTDAIEQILSTRLFEKRLDGYLLETSIQIAEIFEIVRRASVSAPAHGVTDGTDKFLAWLDSLPKEVPQALRDTYQFYLDNYKGDTSPSQVEGYQLVPVEPTEEQFEAALLASSFGRKTVEPIYKAMLAAAPPKIVDDGW